MCSSNLIHLSTVCVCVHAHCFVLFSCGLRRTGTTPLHTPPPYPSRRGTAWVRPRRRGWIPWPSKQGFPPCPNHVPCPRRNIASPHFHPDLLPLQPSAKGTLGSGGVSEGRQLHAVSISAPPSGPTARSVNVPSLPHVHIWAIVWNGAAPSPPLHSPAAGQRSAVADPATVCRSRCSRITLP